MEAMLGWIGDHEGVDDGSLLRLLSGFEADRDPDLAAHEASVARLASRLALSAGLGQRFAERIRLAAAVHDIGKLAIPRQILDKPGALTPAEWDQVTRHPLAGYHILRGAGCETPTFRMATRIALYHHESHDGTGYPSGVSGEEIPIEARIVTICDVYDALRRKRSYKGMMGHDEAMTILLEGDSRTRPSRFCPWLLEAFRETMGCAGLDTEMSELQGGSKLPHSKRRQACALHAREPVDFTFIPG